MTIGEHRPRRHGTGLYSNNLLHDPDALLYLAIDICLVSLTNKGLDLLREHHSRASSMVL